MKSKEDLQGAIKELERIVEDLGKKDIDVETGLEKFRDGVELVKYCRSVLAKSENEFKKLRAELEVADTKDTDTPF